MLRFCTFIDLVKCRGLVAAVVGCAETRCAEAETHCAEAETRCAEACCAEAFAGGNAGVSAAIVVVDLGGTVRNVRLQDTVPCIVGKGW